MIVKDLLFNNFEGENVPNKIHKVHNSQTV